MTSTLDDIDYSDLMNKSESIEALNSAYEKAILWATLHHLDNVKLGDEVIHILFARFTNNEKRILKAFETEAKKI